MWMQIFGDGQRDLIKHLYLANLCWDGMLIAALGALAATLKGGLQNSPAERKKRAARRERVQHG